jgi:hypothetical protein
VAMQVRHAVQNLVEDALDVFWAVLEVGMTHNSRQVVRHVIENHINAPIGAHHFLQLQNISMAQPLQQSNFAHRRQRKLHRLIRIEYTVRTPSFSDSIRMRLRATKCPVVLLRALYTFLRRYYSRDQSQSNLPVGAFANLSHLFVLFQ